MIVGIGTDIVDIRRIEKLHEQYGTKFLERVFSSDELVRAKAKADWIKNLSRRFAGKEAFYKALGSGFLNGVSWQDVEILNRENGEPYIRLSGRSAALLTEKAGSEASVKISLSDDYPYAVAFVVISK